MKTILREGFKGTTYRTLYAVSHAPGFYFVEHRYTRPDTGSVNTWRHHYQSLADAERVFDR